MSAVQRTPYTDGKRLSDGEHDLAPEGVGPGAYWRTGETWWCVPPRTGLHAARLDRHQVEEHEDGTITVSPSILYPVDGLGRGWHGWLERGVWREA